MDKQIYREYVAILKEELQPAMGCTEPIAVAYCAALARQTLGALPETVEVLASANIIKNVKSVIVPNTNGLRGIAAAAAAGIVADNADAQLQVLAELTPEQVESVSTYLQQAAFTVGRSDKDYVFDIQVRVTAGTDSAFVEIAGFHTNVIRVEKNGVVLQHKDYQESAGQHATDRSLLTVENIIAFANEVDIADVQETLQRQIDLNWAIAEEGLRGDYGANIGRILLQSYGTSVHNRAKAYAAAGSDARMNGCDLPVVINSGSGNRGDGVAAGHRLCQGVGCHAADALPRACGVEPRHHPSENRHRQPVRLLRRDGGRLRCGSRRDVSLRRPVPRDCAHHR